MSSSCWWFILGCYTWLPFWLCWKQKDSLSLSITVCFGCDVRGEKEKAWLAKPFPYWDEERRLGCQLRGQLGLPIGHCTHGVRTDTFIPPQGQQRPRQCLQGHGLFLLRKKLMKEATKRWQGDPGCQSVNSHFPPAFLTGKTIRRYSRLSSSRTIANEQLSQAAATGS